jgi:hypothetical protein
MIHTSWALWFARATCRRSFLEGKFRWELQEQSSELVAQTGDLLREPVERNRQRRQLAIVAERARHLDREAKIIRHARCPALVGAQAVVTME